jgi:hypothetical protein
MLLDNLCFFQGVFTLLSGLSVIRHMLILAADYLTRNLGLILRV